MVCEKGVRRLSHGAVRKTSDTFLRPRSTSALRAGARGVFAVLYGFDGGEDLGDHGGEGAFAADVDLLQLDGLRHLLGERGERLDQTSLRRAVRDGVLDLLALREELHVLLRLPVERRAPRVLEADLRVVRELLLLGVFLDLRAGELG